MLDFLLVGVFGMGLFGAALATNISELVGGLVPVLYFVRRRTASLWFVRPHMRWNVIGKACVNGSSEMVTNIAMSLVSVLYNMQLLRYIGEDGADYTSVQPAGKITVGGSSSVSPLMEKLIEAYKTVNPNAELELLTTDSTTGVSGALDGTYTIGMASRELKDSEVEGGAQATVLALDGIAVVVNPANTTEDLTVDQIKGIYTGELTTWADVQ